MPATLSRKNNLLALLVLLLPFSLSTGQDLDQAVVGPQEETMIVVPTHQILKPAGLQIPLPGRPNDLALSPDEKLLAVKNWKSLDLIKVRERIILQSLPYPKSGAAVTGICWSNDGKTIYVSEAEDRIRVAELDKTGVMHWTESLLMPKLESESVVKNRSDTGEIISGDPAPAGLALQQDGKRLFVTLSRYNVLAMVDLPNGAVRTIPVGMAPYDVVLCGNKAYVSNRGGRRPQKGEVTANSSGSPVLVDPKTGIANHGCISVVDLSKLQQVRTIEVGLQPTAMILSPDNSFLYVACTNSDVISVIDTRTDQVIETIDVKIEKTQPLGSAPNALAISPDGATLYVANGADNAICQVRLGSTPSGRLKRVVSKVIYRLPGIPVQWWSIPPENFYSLPMLKGMVPAIS